MADRRPFHPRTVIFLGLLLPGVGLASPSVHCHYTYGGEQRLLIAAPTTSPYTVAALPVGSYFRFRVVFESAPKGLASVKIYAYSDREEGLVPLHQATYAYPADTSRRGHYGFTGQHFVYEPARDGELQYWCEMKMSSRSPAPGKTP